MNFLKVAMYRIWQFKQTLFPKIDQELWKEARSILPETWRCHFDKLRASERAHVLRVYSMIIQNTSIEDVNREEIILFALVHDIGKGITRHSIFFKVAKVVLPISNRAHCIAGAKLLKHLGADMKLVKRVLRHHDKPPIDSLVEQFQQIDDRC